MPKRDSHSAWELVDTTAATTMLLPLHTSKAGLRALARTTFGLAAIGRDSSNTAIKLSAGTMIETNVGIATGTGIGTMIVTVTTTAIFAAIAMMDTETTNVR